MVAPPDFLADVYPNEADRAWIASKVTPQPTATFMERLRITGAYQRVPRKVYIQATGWSGPFDSLVKKLRADATWSIFEIPCGHDVPNLMPNELAAILDEEKDRIGR